MFCRRVVLNRTLGDDLLPPLLVTFGLSVIMQNGLLEIYTADPQKINAGALETASVSVAGLSLGVLPLLTFGGGGRGDLRGCNGCSTTPPLAAPFAPFRTIRTSRS